VRRWFLTVSLALSAVVPSISALAAQPAPPAAQPSAVPASPPPGVSTEPPPTEPSAPPSPTLSPAGVLPSGVTVNVTGDPADAAFVLEQITSALNRAIGPSLRPGATAQYGDPQPAVAPLSVGFQTSLSIPVTISGDAQTAPVQGSVAVQVDNLNVPRQDPVLLFLDDDPEYVRTGGVLFRAKFGADRSVRLYTYHSNVAQQRRFLTVLSSADMTTARVQVIRAGAGPDADVMSVGHAVSRAFVLVEPRNLGTVVDVAAGTPVALRDDNVAAGQGIAAALDVRVLSGGPVTLTVMAIAPGEDPSSYLTAPRVANDGHNRHGAFDLSTAGQISLAYTVGGPDASYEYGSRASGPHNIDPNDPGADAGDYGVVQRITFDLANPLETSATVFLYEQPVGGVVRNSFAIDGTIVDVGCARVSQRYQITSLQMSPQSTQTVHVVTMTDGGSNYPLEVGATTTAPLPTTPPISAPDGCFPKPGFVPPAPSQSGTGAAAPPAAPTPDRSVPAPPTPVPVAPSPPPAGPSAVPTNLPT